MKNKTEQILASKEIFGNRHEKIASKLIRKASRKPGQSNWTAKLSYSDVLEIRKKYKAKRGHNGDSNADELAKKFGVNRAAIMRAAKGRTFKYFEAAEILAKGKE